MRDEITFDQIAVHMSDIVDNVRDGEFRIQIQSQGGIAEVQIQIDQNHAFFRVLRQGSSQVDRDEGFPDTPFGAEDRINLP